MTPGSRVYAGDPSFSGPGLSLMLSPRRKVLLVAAAGFIAFSLLALQASPMSARSMEHRLQQAADTALARAREDVWARVEMDGQRAIVTGLAPDEAARERALAAVSAAAWAGGVVAGGVTRVIDQTRLAQDGAAFALDAHLSSGRLEVTGFAPDADGAARLTTFAERLFPGRATVELRLAPGGAPEAWERAARLMLSELARLDAGDAVMRAERLALTGLASSAQTAESVRAAMRAAPASYAAAALVRAPGGEYAGEVSDGLLCDAFIDAVLHDRAIAFDTGSAQLGDASRQALRRAGELFARCRDLALAIGVRAETGEQAALELAARRARALADAMTDAPDVRARMRPQADPHDAARALRIETQPLRLAPEGAGTGPAPSTPDPDANQEET